MSDIFQEVTSATSGPLSGDYLWSNPANWTLGVPIDGDSVSSTVIGDDDLAALTLSSLTLATDHGEVFVTGGNLNIGTVAGTLDSALDAGTSATGTPGTVTVGTITGVGGDYEAVGAGATFVDQSAIDPGEHYNASDGGVVELSAAPASASELDYFSGKGTFALKGPSATNAVALQNVRQGDVLELPGTSVSNVVFGTNSLTVTTNGGTYAFTQVIGPVSGYTAAHDTATGLEAITFLGPTMFQEVTSATSGPLSGDYLWSNPANWTLGVPIDGDSVSSAVIGDDDLAALTLSSLTLTTNHGEVFVTGGNLNIGTVVGTLDSALGAGTSATGTPGTVTVGTITGVGGDYEAVGAGATFVDQSAIDPGEHYNASDGGVVELSAAPASASELDYFSGKGTFALKDPSATNAVALQNVRQGDVLELPGTSVSNVVFGTNSLTVTTNGGTYAFTQVIGPVSGYTAAHDTTTGLEAITFLGPTMFQEVTSATSGPLSGDYLWSNPANWTLGVPIDGDSVSSAVIGDDDLAALTLSSLTLTTNHGEVFVTGGNLNIGTVVGTLDSALGAGTSATGTPGTVTVGTITGVGGDYEAVGAGATFVDQSAIDPGEHYNASDGGVVELSAAPASASELDYFSGKGTFALKGPSATNAVALQNVRQGDVLELPGTSVSNVVFGTNSLTVTTNGGTYAFTQVIGPVSGYTAAHDTATGLEAITFLGPTMFQEVTSATSGPLSGDYLWSNPANWTLGVPIDGDSVSSAVIGDDDLAALTLSSLTLTTNHGEVFVTGGNLNIGTVVGTLDSALGAGTSATGTPGTVTVGTITGVGGDYEAVGAGATFVDQSAIDPGEHYNASDGGVVELSAAPASASELDYFSGKGTFALKDPSATNAVALQNVRQGDVLELPGTSVSNVVFGTNSLTVTTNGGTYAFTQVIGPVSGYTAAHDTTTGLEAITFLGPTMFQEVTSATSGPLSGDYLWSNPANWTLGVPIDGDSVSSAVIGDDDLAALTLSSLTLTTNHGEVFVTGGNLNIGTVVGTLDSALGAGTSATGTPGTVTVGTITGVGGDYEAVGAGATFVDQSAIDPGEHYNASDGGVVELSAAPASASELDYFSGKGTFALEDPSVTNAALLDDVTPNDVLELPGTSVSNVVFGTNSLTVMTNDGTYSLTNVSYDMPVTGYTAAVDPTTGLEAITFVAPPPSTTFEPNEASSIAPYTGFDPWSDAKNWSAGIPANGDDVLTTTISSFSHGIDDINGLVLASLTQAASSLTEAVGDLTIGMLVVGDANSSLDADGDYPSGEAATVTIDAITGNGGALGAFGAGGVLNDLATNAVTETYDADHGGEVILASTPGAGSALVYAVNGIYDGTTGIFALKNPTATIDASLTNVAGGDVLELPGTSVSNVVCGTSSLSVTTSAGTFTFNDVSYRGSLDSYSAVFDPDTGLEAITFVAPPPPPPSTTFEPNEASSIAPYTGFDLWSDAKNWSAGIPANGDDVLTTTISSFSHGIDDIDGLVLASLTQAASSLTEAVGGLTIGTLTVGGTLSEVFADGDYPSGEAATITIDAVSGNGGELGAAGVGGVLDDLATNTVIETYSAYIGGEVILATAPGTGSVLEFGENGSATTGTIALKNPTATIDAALTGVMGGDVLELPGTSASNVTFGTSSLSVTTSAGSYTFNDVSYAGSLVGYTAAADPTTGLEAITFVAPPPPPPSTTFEPFVAATSGPYASYSLWSNSLNWSAGVPIGGDDVLTTTGTSFSNGIDDISSLVVGTLTQAANSQTQAVDDLTIGTLTVGGALSTVFADGDYPSGEAATITIDAVSGNGGELGAAGVGGVLDDLATNTVIETYSAYIGGEVILATAPGTGSVLEFGENGSATTGTIALKNPTATIDAALTGVMGGDVLELPGTSASNVTFGTSSLSITTSAGSYTFNNVSYENGQPIGYTAAYDTATGLEAITFIGSTIFHQVTAATSGAESGDYLWSNVANWTNGVPIDGDSVSSAVIGFDDIAALALASLTLTSGGIVSVIGSSLNITTVTGTAGGELEANADDAGAPVSVTAGVIDGTGGYYGASGAGAIFMDQSSFDHGEYFFADDGGLVELSATPASTSELDYSSGTGTFALKDPSATDAVALADVRQGDVLELPGTSVSNVVFGTNSLAVTTNDGTYAFTNVSFDTPITGYTAAYDVTTGLEAITFTGPTMFEHKIAATGGPLSGDYLWSNVANWTNGVPIDGDSVSSAVIGFDDIAALALASLTLTSSGIVSVIGSSLNITTVTGTAGGELEANADDAGAPVSVTAGVIDGTGGYYGASGAGAIFMDQSSFDHGEYFFADDGGLVELSATPASTSELDYSSGTGTFALKDPSATDAVALADVRQGDVLELPGTSVSNVVFGTNSLAVTTNDGTYAFTNVSFDTPITGYTAAYDVTTGLEAITFTGPTMFQQVTAVASGPLSGGYLWSNPANWTNGLPVTGQSVTTAVTGYDDISTLSLANLTLTDTGDAGVDVVATALTIATVSGVGYLMADTGFLGFPVTVTVGSISGTGSNYEAVGVGATFVDQSATDAGNTYFALAGGVVELAAVPASTSTLEWGGSDSTIALEDPGAANSVALDGIDDGDVLELPGTSVSNAVFGTNSLIVTTSDGTYAFTNVSYDMPVTGYTAAIDPNTGLEAITFTHPSSDTFSQNAYVNTFKAFYFPWSSVANWSSGVPVNGNDVTFGLKGIGSPAVTGLDDIANLTLGTLTFLDNSALGVVGNLSVKDLLFTPQTAANQNGITVATGPFDPESAITSATLSIGAIDGADASVGAEGSGAVVNDLAAADPGEGYTVQDAGEIVLAAQPSSASVFDYEAAANETPGTFAFLNPGSLVSSQILEAMPGDVLEVPGSFVLGFSIGTANSVGESNLLISTDAGAFDFKNFGLYLPVEGYSAAADPTTGLLAFTLSAAPSFSVVATWTNAVNGDWNTSADWSGHTVPVGSVAALEQQGSYTVSIGAGETDSASDLLAAGGTLAVNGLDAALSIFGALTVGDAAVGSGAVFIGVGSEVSTPVVTVADGTLILSGGSIVSDPIFVSADGSISGFGQVFGNVTNGATITAVGGSLELRGDITGTDGLLAVGVAGNLQFDGSVGSDQSLDFIADTGQLTLEHADLFSAVVSGFQAGDVIDAVGATSGIQLGDLLTLYSGQAELATIAFRDAPAGLSVGSDGEITAPAAACFVQATRISTDRGEVAVEDLAIGDLVHTQHAGLAPVKWIGHRRADCRRHPKPQIAWPVRVRAGAFGIGMPRRDLWLSPDHSVFVDDVLIPIKFLSNDSTIEQVPMDDVTYYHVELPNHEVLLAEGLPAESYLDTGDRLKFENGGSIATLHPDLQKLKWQAEGCAQLIVTGPILQAVRQRVNSLVPAGAAELRGQREAHTPHAA